MKIEEYSWKSFDGLKYYGRSWLCEEKVRGLICLVHGIGEHCSRYNDWSQRFVRNGYHVISMDYRGHGKSEGKRGHTPSYCAYMNDLELLLAKATIMFPGLPVILYGHSMGGNLVVNYYLRRKAPIDALVVTSPWFKLEVEPQKISVFMARLVKSFLPGLTKKTGLKTQDLTQNTGATDMYDKDELVHGKISVKAFLELYQAGLHAFENSENIHIPMLLMHGKEDRITSCEASVQFAKHGTKHITLKTWDGYYHELHNEIGKDKVFYFIINWIDEILFKKNQLILSHEK